MFDYLKRNADLNFDDSIIGQPSKNTYDYPPTVVFTSALNAES
jgi:hypothetical protein